MNSIDNISVEQALNGGNKTNSNINNNKDSISYIPQQKDHILRDKY